MGKIDQHRQQQIDESILWYVREMQDLAPVTGQSVHSYLTGAARIRIELGETRDRLLYLVKLKDLDRIEEWDGGELVRFEITAQGMDRLDGNIPPRNWRAGRN